MSSVDNTNSTKPIVPLNAPQTNEKVPQQKSGILRNDSSDNFATHKATLIDMKTAVHETVSKGVKGFSAEISTKRDNLIKENIGKAEKQLDKLKTELQELNKPRKFLSFGSPKTESQIMEKANQIVKQAFSNSKEALNTLGKNLGVKNKKLGDDLQGNITKIQEKDQKKQQETQFSNELEGFKHRLRTERPSQTQNDSKA